MTRLTVADLDADGLVQVVLERLARDGVIELHAEGAYVSTVACAVTSLKASYTDKCVVSNVASSAGPDSAAGEMPFLSASDDAGPVWVTVCLRAVQQTCKKVQARTRSYTTLRTAATLPKATDSAGNSPTARSSVSHSPPPPAAAQQQKLSPVPPPAVAGEAQSAEPAAAAPPELPRSGDMHPAVQAAVESAVHPAVQSARDEIQKEMLRDAAGGASGAGEGQGSYADKGGVLLFPDGIPQEEEEEGPSLTDEELRACMPCMPADPDFHTLFFKCAATGKRPAARLFPKSCKAFTEEEAKKYHAEHPEEAIALCYDMSDYSEVAWNYKYDRWATMRETDYFEDLLEALYNTKGAFMTEAVTEKHLATVEGDRMLCASGTMQGWRSSNEDAHAAIVSLPQNKYVAFFGVYDGHGGWRVADFVGRHLHGLVDAELAAAGAPLSPERAEAALRAAFLKTDEQIQEELPTDHCGSTGSTVNVALVLNRSHLVVANAGDSRAVLCRGGQAVRLSHDHKPDSPRERQRILQSGSRVSSDGRVEGMLAVSRALGDIDFKQAGALGAKDQAVTADPSVECFTLGADDRFMVQACDGIWDALSDQEAVDFVAAALAAGKSPPEVVAALCDKCLSPSIESEGIGTDNMTVNLVLFR